MNTIKRKTINILSGGNIINTFEVTDSTTVADIALACSITLVEAQVLLDTRITDDLNNFCCNSPLPIINSITAVSLYTNPRSVVITIDITNPDNANYTMEVKEGQTTLLNYTGSDLVNTISNLTFIPRQKRIFDIEIILNNCAGEVKQTKTISL